MKNYFRVTAVVLLTCLASGVAAQVSTGTAFAVAPGLLITNQHVVAECSSVEVITANGRYTAAIVGADSQVDLALLRVNGLKGATARLRNPRNIRLGESVMVFGFPLAGSLTSGGNFTSGLVSGLRGLRDAAGEIQITAPVQPGNSGGPLMDASGLVIGVVQAKLDAIRSAIVTGDIPQNVNFAISLEVLADFLAKNRVLTRSGALAPALQTARVAELAQGFTYRVECQEGSQQATASSPIISAKSPSVDPSPSLVEPPVRSFKDCNACPEMVTILPGSFLMGSPNSETGRRLNETQHRVTISRSFSVGKYEVTFDEWDACVSDNGCTYRPSDEGWGRGRLPVINVSREDAKEYVEWLSRKTSKSYRLPTEAEWEYAARAGTTTAFAFGNSISPSQANFNYSANVPGSEAAPARSQTAPVGSYPANGFGLHDMHGNVWEWTEDCYNENSFPSDGAGWDTGMCSYHTLRGGSWSLPFQTSRSSSRYGLPASTRFNTYGFRVVRME